MKGDLAVRLLDKNSLRDEARILRVLSQAGGCLHWGELVRRSKLSKATLSNRLKDLEVNHRVIRKRENNETRPPTVEYYISPNEPTPYGKCILELAHQLHQLYNVPSEKDKIKEAVSKIWNNPLAIRFQEQVNEIFDEEMKDLAVWIYSEKGKRPLLFWEIMIHQLLGGTPLPRKELDSRILTMIDKVVAAAVKDIRPTRGI
jgi:DNA-binding HxlR family transcriptional regulator